MARRPVISLQFKSMKAPMAPSTNAPLPDEILRFIADHVETVDQLEVFLLLRRHADRSWTAHDTSSRRSRDPARGGVMCLRRAAELRPDPGVQVRDQILYLLWGATEMGCCTAALHFLRFWRRSRDRLFLAFALSS